MMDDIQLWHLAVVAMTAAVICGTARGDETTISLDESIDFQNSKIKSEKDGDIYPLGGANLQSKSVVPPKAIKHSKDNTKNTNNIKDEASNGFYSSENNNSSVVLGDKSEVEEEKSPNKIIRNDAKNHEDSIVGTTSMVSNSKLTTKSQNNPFLHLDSIIDDQQHSTIQKNGNRSQIGMNNVILPQNAGNSDGHINSTRGNNKIMGEHPFSGHVNRKHNNSPNITIANVNNCTTSNGNCSTTKFKSDDGEDSVTTTNKQIGSHSSQKVVHVHGTRNNLPEENLQKGQLPDNVLYNHSRDSQSSLPAHVDRNVTTVNVTLTGEQQKLYSNSAQEKPLESEKNKIGGVNVSSSFSSKTIITPNDRTLNRSTQLTNDNHRSIEEKQDTKTKSIPTQATTIKDKSISLVNPLSALITTVSPFNISKPTTPLSQTYHVNKTSGDSRLPLEINSDDTQGKINPSNSSSAAHQFISANISHSNFDLEEISLDNNQTNNEGLFNGFNNISNNNFNIELPSSNLSNSYNLSYDDDREGNLSLKHHLSDLVQDINVNSSSFSSNIEHQNNLTVEHFPEDVIYKNNNNVTELQGVLLRNNLTAENLTSTSKQVNSSSVQSTVTFTNKQTVPTATPNGTNKFLYYTYKDKLQERLQHSSTKSPNILIDVLSSKSSQTNKLPSTTVRQVSPTPGFKTTTWQDDSEDYEDSDTYDYYDDSEDGDDNYNDPDDSYDNKDNEYDTYEGNGTDDHLDNGNSDTDHNTDLQWLHHMENVGEHLINTDTNEEPDKINVGIWAHDPYNHPGHHSFFQDNSLSLMVFYTWLAVVTFMLIISYVAFKHRQAISNFITDRKLSYRRRRTLRTEEGHQLLSATPYV